MPIAVAACAEHPKLDDDWVFLRDALADVGLAGSAQVWTDPAVDWRAFDLVLVRGTWDYVGRLGEFIDWVTAVGDQTRLVNPAAVLRWNSDKRYLADLAAAGVPIVPTLWVGPGQEWQPPGAEFVIKPTVSAGGFETARYGIDDLAAARQHVARLHERGSTVMVQPYQAAVDERGETALIYLGGQFSHAVRKGPLLQLGAGVVDELWQREQITAAEPTDLELDVAEGALAAAHRIGGPITYARVDLVPGTDAALLDVAVLELELIEPSLFLDTSPGAPELFAKSIRQLVGLVR
jgi:glutathione synthase/RimK-type ligase-like ATP-grasp enzyme